MIKDERVKIESMDERDGGGLIDCIDITYRELVELFGEPHTKDIDNYKSDAKWSIRFDNVSFSIYNYKDGINYLKDEGTEVEFITNWHIGGEYKSKGVEFIKWIEKNRSGAKPVIEECQIQSMLEDTRITLSRLDPESLCKVNKLVNKLI